MEKQEKGRRTEKNGHYKSIKQPQDKHIMPYENFSKSDAVWMKKKAKTTAAEGNTENINNLC